MKQAFVKLHLSILIAGFTGLFGRWITLAEGPLVWWRMLFAAAMFLAYLGLRREIPRPNLRDAADIAGVGALLALHWILFFASIKYSNVSVGVVCYSLAGFFCAFFEPAIERRRISGREVLYSLITVLGIMLVFHFDTRHRTGILIGVVSSALGALFTIYNRRVGMRHSSTTMLLYEMLGGFVFLCLVGPVYLFLFPETRLTPSGGDFLYLLALSSVCTIGLYLLLIQALTKVSAFTANLSYNLEPVYSIALAMLFFGEARELSASFYVGLGLVCLSVALQTVHVARDGQSSSSR